MNQAITRQILWNVPVAFIVLMYALLAALSVAFVFAAAYWYRRVQLGVPECRSDRPLLRAWLMLRDAIGQGYVVRETWGWMHYAMYVGFIGLFIGTNIIFLNGNIRDLAGLFGLPLYFYFGDFYLFFKAAMDSFFVIFTVGVIASAYRRKTGKPWILSQPPANKLLDNYENRIGYWYPLLMLVLVAVTGLCSKAHASMLPIRALPSGHIWEEN